MTQKEIITLTESLGFVLDLDRYESGSDSTGLKYLRFISSKLKLDEKDLRWIWYKEDSDEDNIVRGQCIKSRIDKKREVANFLKY
jgi:hypothetical protein